MHILTPYLLALDGWMPPPAPWTCFITTDEDTITTGGGTKPTTKTFSQEEVDRIIAERLTRERRAFEAKLAESTKAESDKSTGLQKQLDELTARLEDAGKTATEKETAAIRRELQAMTQRLNDAGKTVETLTKERDGALARHRDEVVATRFGEALAKQKALPTALRKAVSLLRSEAQVELDAEGKLAVTWNGRVYDEGKLGQLGKDFLADNPFLASHPGGGTGTQSGPGRAPFAAGEFNEADYGKGLEMFGRQVAARAGASSPDDV